MEQTGGQGADRGCECVGYQAHDPQGNEEPSLTMNNLVNSVRFTGRDRRGRACSCPQDPGGPGRARPSRARWPFDFGMLWFKGQSMGTGQCPVKKYNRRLRDLIAAGKAKPSWIVSHELPLDQAAEAYENFDARPEGWTKVVLKPGMSTGTRPS